MTQQQYALQGLLNSPVYQAYAYSYPHKMAYRPFSDKVALREIWQQEKLDALYLYVHIPFCKIRCGFCNLFTLVKPDDSLPDLYLDALSRQINALAPVIEQAGFSHFSIGGGTPTYLDEKQLERLFTLTSFPGITAATAKGIECSPETVTAGKIQLLEANNIRRISMGVQSFTELEVKNLARRQNLDQVINAIETIRSHSQADLNLDLIYGIPGQTVDSWLYSLAQAVSFQPEELYLYPLYVRDDTGLGKVLNKQGTADTAAQTLDEHKLMLFRAGRDYLLANGYQQISMRMFRRVGLPAHDQANYSCQRDGMLGLGAGARSYTNSLHYSSEYAVDRHSIRDIISHYLAQSETDFSFAHYGIRLDLEEKKRRFVIQSLLIADGLNLADYHARFHCDCLVEFPLLNTLLQAQFAVRQGDVMQLTPSGFERADSIGPWFVSDKVKQAMAEYRTGC
ncbi:coproporphyrinogen III oxidase [Shewanella sp. NFH-SH190041]|uniref:STM4012 family radical SAM protein n=1 Tax=Shewanella sp. NFH-SH190041 TaxID=2950245 RepID=UPI0021C35CB5|nr:STM4012 family radical SAM protein [Shewanella sp. NFH-SH190041]BDM62821.1 coproporphyrinogen III oxidase [Shewanella sp. NFH-SH190041]